MKKTNRQLVITFALCALIFAILCVLYFLKYTPVKFTYQNF